MTRVLVCGDVHGHIHHLLDIIEAAERHYGRIDSVLQVGDMGVWNPATRGMDKATLKFAREDPDELALLNLLDGTDPRSERLSERKWPPLYFVRGNHDDGEYLRSVGKGAVDQYGILHNIPGGEVVEVSGHKVGALGGVYYPAWNSVKSSRLRYTQPAEARGLLKKEMQIIISHDAPVDMMGPTTGSPWLSAIMERACPAFVFCGHYHRPAVRALYGDTEAWELNQIHSPRHLTERFAGILHNDSFEILENGLEEELHRKWYSNP